MKHIRAPRLVSIESPQATTMQKHIVDPGQNRRLKMRKLWKSGLGILGIALLVTVALDSPAALNYLVPKVPGHPKGVGARVGW